ncbi:MAG: acyl carrier protein [Clostridia bacterium]|jgi:acyl carrier protein|nr:acyl carrier protein [Clostridia bacterium]
MSKIVSILEDIKPGIDYENCKELIDGHYLDSLSIISLIAELEDEFDITIPAVEIVPANFNSVEQMAAMVERLQEE